MGDCGEEVRAAGEEDGLAIAVIGGGGFDVVAAWVGAEGGCGHDVTEALRRAVLQGRVDTAAWCAENGWQDEEMKVTKFVVAYRRQGLGEGMGYWSWSDGLLQPMPQAGRLGVGILSAWTTRSTKDVTLALQRAFMEHDGCGGEVDEQLLEDVCRAAALGGEGVRVVVEVRGGCDGEIQCWAKESGQWVRRAGDCGAAAAAGGGGRA
jgi:hypothetical protein